MLQGTGPLTDLKNLPIAQNKRTPEVQIIFDQLTKTFSPEVLSALANTPIGESIKELATLQDLQADMKEWLEDFSKDVKKSGLEYKAALKARWEYLNHKSLVRERENKLLALGAMGLTAIIPQGFANEISPIARQMQKRTKNLQIPENITYQHTPLLNQTLGNLLKDKTPAVHQIAASAITLAQLGVPEKALAALSEKKDLKGLLDQMNKFLLQTTDNSEIKLNPLERIRKMAE